MIIPTSEPEGWFLFKARHEHTQIIFKGDEHRPVDHPEGAWEVGFQKKPNGGRLVTARGNSLFEAWVKATAKAIEVDKGLKMGDYL